MNKLPWSKSFIGSFIGLAMILILIGIAPLAYVTWRAKLHNLELVSMPLPLRAGEYTSPFFTTNLLDDNYQIGIDGLRYNRKPLDIDWKIVDETGAMLAGDHYKETARDGGGNVVSLAQNYHSKRWVRQRAIVTLHQDMDAPISGDTRFFVSDPEMNLEMSYAWPFDLMWAVMFAGSGVVLLFLAQAHQVANKKSQMN